jgi:D-alanine--D-alanine ligase
MDFREKMQKWGRVGVLMGGYSSERAISLKSGQAIFQALEDLKMDVVPVDIHEKDKAGIRAQIQEAHLDMAFIALHGALGEDGQIQSLLEEMNILYTGSGIRASQLAINKIAAQDCFRRHHVSIPESFALSRAEGADKGIQKVAAMGGFPVVVKPATEGSSIGIQVSQEEEHFRQALVTAWEYGEDVLVERYIDGREFTVSLLDRKPLPVIEICPQHQFFDFDCKYSPAATKYVVPAKISPVLAGTLQSVALKAYRLLGCADFGRVDLIVDQDLNHYVLEVNTIPGFTATSLLPKAAKELGISFHELCLQIMEIAYGKKKEEKDKSITI